MVGTPSALVIDVKAALVEWPLKKKSIQEIKDPNHEAANSTYVSMITEQIEFLKKENKVKNFIIRSLTKQYNNTFNCTTTYNSNNNNDNNSSIKIMIMMKVMKVIIIILIPLTTIILIIPLIITIIIKIIMLLTLIIMLIYY